MSIFISFIVSASLAFMVGRALLARKQQKIYPPGPKGLPFIGNALDFPTVNVGQEYVKWGKKYNSDILHASALGSHVVVINSRKVADDLFEGRAIKYSDRPHMPTIDLAGMSMYNIGAMRYGEKWRLCRKLSQQAFRQAASPASNLSTVIINSVHQALNGLLHSPENLWDHNKMLSISIPMSSMYGYEAETVKDPCVTAADESFTINMELVSPGGSLINILPILRFIPPWFPGAVSRRKAQKARELTDKMLQIPLDFVKSQVANGNAKPSLVAALLEKKQTVGVSEDEEAAILAIAPTAYAGGSDTTQSATGTFIYLMVANQEVQKKAQAEIDSILESKRLPGFEDRPAMPYVEAIYREVLRWRPPGSLGFAHSVTEDDIYDGYLIPKGAIIMGNIWAMTHDETIYPDPMAFKPERFINSDGSLNDDDRIMAFGFGRRVCVGKHVASATLWLTIVSILAVFKLERAQDHFGMDIEANGEYDEFGLISRKKPFKCSILPRSAGARQLIEQVAA